MRRKSITTIAVALTALLSLSACAGGSVSGGDSPSSTASGELEKLTLGMWPSSAVAAFEIAKEAGIFEENGIDLEIVLGQGSAAHLPAVSSGTMDFLVGSERGLDVKIVAGYAVNNPDVPDDSTVVVASDGSIQSAKDLSGKRVSVNALGSIGEIGIKEAVALDGGDPNSIEFIQLGLHEVQAQLDAGQIDAGMTGMPFAQTIIDGGGHIVSDFIKDADLGDAELVIVGGGKTLTDKADATARFIDALEEALPYANEHQDEIREMLPDLLGTDPQLAQEMAFMHWDAEIHTDALNQFADLMDKYEIVDNRPDVEAAIWND